MDVPDAEEFDSIPGQGVEARCDGSDQSCWATAS